MKTINVATLVLLVLAPAARAQVAECINQAVSAHLSAPGDRTRLMHGLTVATPNRTGVSDCTGSGAVTLLPGDDPFSRYFFPPELVMAHQQEIALTDRQRVAIQDSMKEAQSKFVDMQFKMTALVETLQQLLRPAAVDEAKVLDQVDRVLSLERDIKRAQVTLMIRIKNQLTESQQATLTKLR